MPDLPKPTDAADDQWIEQLAVVRSEVRLPGFWATLVENSESWSKQISVGLFWTKAYEQLDQWRTEYRNKTGGDLLTSPGLPIFVAKPEKSVRDKLSREYRRDKDNFRSLIGTDGPPVPRLKDLVRTRIACRYIDGVEFLTGKLLALATEMKLSPEHSREGRIEGYFAQHLNFCESVVFRLGGQEQLAHVTCEVQLASEMATRMWDAAHPFYEQTRSAPGDPAEWQWKPSDARFISNQLGHMIHLADGLLVQLRESVTRGRT